MSFYLSFEHHDMAIDQAGDLVNVMDVDGDGIVSIDEVQRLGLFIWI